MTRRSEAAITTLHAIRDHTYGIKVELIVWECSSCGIVYGIPLQFANEIKKKGPMAHYFCPNGHQLSWHESEAERERKRAVKAERELSASRDTAARYKANADAERRSAIAYKGHLTRVRRRIISGVCPVPGCKRSGFTQVMRHIATQHPDWLHEHPEAADAAPS